VCSRPLNVVPCWPTLRYPTFDPHVYPGGRPHIEHKLHKIVRCQYKTPLENPAVASFVWHVCPGGLHHAEQKLATAAFPSGVFLLAPHYSVRPFLLTTLLPMFLLASALVPSAHWEVGPVYTLVMMFLATTFLCAFFSTPAEVNNSQRLGLQVDARVQGREVGLY
jgi:hypothetical protein